MGVVRLGVIGLGNMGTYHLRNIATLPNVELTALCDILPERVELAQKTYPGKGFLDHRDLLASRLCDAVVIATPHYDHVTSGIDALKAGLHVLVEKPIAVHKADATRLIAAHTRRKQVFAAMLNQRTNPQYLAVRQLVKSGALGRLQRVVWIVTNWFRTNEYYRSSSWRATWAGEGGGVLTNQATHQLDLLQWICGMPVQVTAFCGLGKYHPIEVEDDVTAYVEFRGGATGVFIASTGDAPGTNRLELTGDMGKVVVGDDGVTFVENTESARKMALRSKDAYATPAHRTTDIPANGSGDQHLAILRNFIDAIQTGAPLIAPAREGLRSVELGNAMLCSALTGAMVELPLDAKKYARLLARLIATSKRKPRQARIGAPRMRWMFGR